MANTIITQTAGIKANDYKATLSFWVKRGFVDGAADFHGIISSNTGYETGNGYGMGFFEDFFVLYKINGAASSNRMYTDRKFRDTSAWYHIVVQIDTTQVSVNDRIKLYVNGVYEGAFTTGISNMPSQDTAPYKFFENGETQTIGSGAGNGGYASFFDGCLSHFYYCDGYAYDASSFGSTNAATGEWVINTSPSVSYGTTGFLILKDGNGITDQSPNSNNWTAGTGTLTNTEDCPTDVFCVFNALDNYYQAGTYSNGNTTFQTNTSNYTYNSSTIGISKGKFYWEIEYEAKSSSNDDPLIGITSTQPTNTDNELGKYVNDWGYYEQSGTPYYRNNSANTSYGTTYDVGDVICVALDADNAKLYFRINGGSWENSGDPTSGATGTGAISITAPASTPLGAYFPSVCFLDGSSNGTFKANFGNGYFGTTIISSEGTNASGIGKFEYDVPAGYTAISAKGLQE